MIHTKKIRFINLDEPSYRLIQKAALEQGYYWNTPTLRNRDCKDYKEKHALVLDSDGELMHGAPSPALSDTTINIQTNHIVEFEKLFGVAIQQTPQPEQPTPTPQPTQPQPTTETPMNPYEIMVADIEKRLLDMLSKQLPNEDKVQQLIAAEVLKFGRTLITIEDKRTTPPTTTEVSEAVHEKLPDLIGVLNSECWPALVGPTGSGKTLGVMQCAKILKVDIVCIKQMTRIIAPHDLIGYMDAEGHYRKGAWTDAIIGYKYESASGAPDKLVSTPAWIVVDEMDNANENIIMILKAIQTKRIAMPYGMQDINPRLQVIATMNTYGTGATREYVGRCAQDAALLNEFQFIDWGYDTSFEWELLQKLHASYTDPGKYKLEDFRRLLDMFIAMRAKADNNKVRCIIATRNVINVAKMLVANPTWPVSKALQMSIFKGLKEDEIKRMECPEIWTTKHHTTKPNVTDRRRPELQRLGSNITTDGTFIYSNDSDIENPIK